MSRWIIGAAAAVILALSGCKTEDPYKAANSRILVEDSHWETSDGRFVHDFTLVNGNQLAVRDVVVRFHYLDYDGKELGHMDYKFTTPLQAHDAVRETRIDGGPMLSRTGKVTYEVLRARANMRDGAR